MASLKRGLGAESLPMGHGGHFWGNRLMISSLHPYIRMGGGESDKKGHLFFRQRRQRRQRRQNRQRRRGDRRRRFCRFCRLCRPAGARVAAPHSPLRAVRRRWASANSPRRAFRCEGRNGQCVFGSRGSGTVWSISSPSVRQARIGSSLPPKQMRQHADGTSAKDQQHVRGARLILGDKRSQAVALFQQVDERIMHGI